LKRTNGRNSKLIVGTKNIGEEGTEGNEAEEAGVGLKGSLLHPG